jgi:murein DD-endopeptidase MepM/ murein hydrolase activator NlpD
VRYLYMTDGPDVLSFVVGTSSFTDILDNLELLSRIGRQDKEIAAEVRDARDGVAEARRQTRAARADQARVEAVVASATTEQRGVVTRLVASRDALVAAQREKSSALASIEANQSQIHEEIEDLEAESAALAEQIRRAQQPSSSGSTSTPPVVPIGNGTLGWPVSGPVVSGFGMRWGRMHEGIDITCSTGTPVRAAGNGTVIWASWRGGYGNAVVIDHGGGLATLYAHNSAFATSVGQTVVRGQVIAYAGSTGNSSGPHVHFEVRVNGTAVDPLGYL